MDRRRYSDEDRANAIAALAANGGDMGKTSRQLGIPWMTLYHWRVGDRHPEAIQMGELKKAALADRLEEIAHDLLDSMPDKIAEAKLSQVAVALGISVEKMQLLRGKPTSIAGEELDDRERAKRINAILDGARARRDGFPADAPPPDHTV